MRAASSSAAFSSSARRSGVAPPRRAALGSAEARRIADAALFAARAHAGQVREDSGEPYVNHLAEVAAFLSALEPFDPVLVTAAWLHDVIEDTGITADDLAGHGYAPEVIQAAYRIGDSVTNVISPMMSYFGLIMAMAAKYKKDVGMGTLIAMMLPYSMVFIVGWTLLFYLWVFVLGLPVGWETPTYYQP